MTDFDKIFLSWRTGQGKGRHLVGVLEKHLTGSYTFKYDQQAVKKAEQEGFAPYTEFVDLTKTYNGNVLDVFTQRLTKANRSDVQSFYDFWEIEPEHIQDKFYLLGHTQGLLPTDNFEFLAEYKAIDGLHFLTDLAFVSQKKLAPGTVKQGDQLQYVLEPKNEHDSHAVRVFKGSLELGYIKKVHSRVFHQTSDLKLVVKAVDQNGVIKRIFVKVSR